jgi:hypothetical protein
VFINAPMDAGDLYHFMEGFGEGDMLMAKKTTPKYIILGISVLILETLARGSFQVGVVTPTPEANV